MQHRSNHIRLIVIVLFLIIYPWPNAWTNSQAANSALAQENERTSGELLPRSEESYVPNTPNNAPLLPVEKDTIRVNPATVLLVRVPRLIALAGLLFIWFKLLYGMVFRKKKLVLGFCWTSENIVQLVFSATILASLAYEAAVFGIQPPIFLFLCVPLFWLGVVAGGLLTLKGCEGPRPRKCCCCANSVSIQNIHDLIVRDTAGNIIGVGHQFDCVIEMQYKAGTAGKCSCTLHWNERTDIPPTDVPNYPPNQWVDVFQIYPQSPIFNNWRNRVEPCPNGGPLSVTITDIPFLVAPGMTITRYLDFNIVVESCQNCGCSPIWPSDTARQEIEIINGVPTIPAKFRHP